MKTRRFPCCLLLLLALIGCGTLPEKKGQQYVSEPLQVSVKPDVNIRRISISKPLNVVIDPGIPEKLDYVTINGQLLVPIVNYRSAIQGALNETFRRNFPQVTFSAEETGSGIEIVLVRANLQADNSMSFQAILVYSGKDAFDIGGATTSRTIQLSSTIYTWVEDARSKYVKPLTEEAISKMCIAVYDRFFKDQDVTDSQFWENVNTE